MAGVSPIEKKKMIRKEQNKSKELTTANKVFYNQKGNECDEEHCVAYRIEKEVPVFYIKEYCGQFMTADTVCKSSEVGRTKFRKVGSSTFASYIKYLKTNLQSHYNMIICKRQ